MNEIILYEIRNKIAIIQLNRPEVLNSFNADMAAQFLDTLKNASNDDNVRAILLTGIGRAFSAGQDLSEVISKDGSSTDLGEIVKKQYNPIIKLLRETGKPVVCAVNGVAAGAGANIALACDIVVASEAAVFIQSFASIGLIPDSGGTFMLPRLVGMANATALVMLGDKIPAEKAREIGMIYEVKPENEYYDTAMAIAEKLANMPTKGLGLTKHLLNQTFDNSLNKQLDLEEDMQSQAGMTYDYKEGVQAFIEKRKPEFKGK